MPPLVRTTPPPGHDALGPDVATHDILVERARLTPSAVAVAEVDPSGDGLWTWTHGQLRDESMRLALALSSRFSPGERIALWAPNSPEWILLQFAAGLAGLTLVAIDPAIGGDDLEAVLERSGAVGLFLGGVAPNVRPTPGVVREVVDLADTRRLFAKHRLVDGLPVVRPDDLALIQHVAGAPTGVPLSHRQLAHAGRRPLAMAWVGPEDTALHLMPMFHTAGGAALTLGAVHFGCRLMVAGPSDPSLALDLIEREGVTIVLGLPATLTALIEAQAERPRKMASVRLVLAGGGATPAPLVRQVRSAFGCNLLSGYDRTDASEVITLVR